MVSHMNMVSWCRKYCISAFCLSKASVDTAELCKCALIHGIGSPGMPVPISIRITKMKSAIVGHKAFLINHFDVW